MKKLLLVALFALIVSWTYAQKPTNTQSRQMNLLAIELIDRYESNSTLWDKYAKTRFPKLFESKDTEIFCDLFHNADYCYRQIPVDKYVSFIEETGCRINRVQLSNIKKQDVWYADGRWYYSLTFDKDIVYWDSNGVLFPVGVDDNGNDTRTIFKMVMTLVFDSELENAYIHSISSQNPDALDKTDKLIIVQKSEDKYQRIEQMVTSNNLPLRYNSFDQASVPSLQFRHPNEDVLIGWTSICEEESYDLIKLKYSSRSMRFRLRNEIAPIMYSIVENSNKYKGRSFGYSIGLDLGATFRLGKKTKCGFYAGAAFTVSNFTANVNNINDYAISFSDSNGKKVERVYNIDRISQKAKFTDLTIPVYFNVESKVNQKINLVFDIGAKMYVSLDRMCGNAFAEGIVDGESFTSVYIDSASATSSKYDASLFFNAGVDYVIVPRRLYLEGKIGYEGGFRTIKFSGNESLQQGALPVLYNGITGEDVLVAPILNDISIRKSALWIGVGLKLKF